VADMTAITMKTTHYTLGPISRIILVDIKPGKGSEFWTDLRRNVRPLYDEYKRQGLIQDYSVSSKVLAAVRDEPATNLDTLRTASYRGPTHRQRHTRRKPGPQSHGSLKPSATYATNATKGPRDRRAAEANAFSLATIGPGGFYAAVALASDGYALKCARVRLR
jgi:hypothetical protein